MAADSQAKQAVAKGLAPFLPVANATATYLPNQAVCIEAELLPLRRSAFAFGSA